MGCDLLKSVDLEKKAETMKGGNGAIGIPKGIFIEPSRFGAMKKKWRTCFLGVTLW